MRISGNDLIWRRPISLVIIGSRLNVTHAHTALQPVPGIKTSPYAMQSSAEAGKKTARKMTLRTANSFQIFTTLGVDLFVVVRFSRVEFFLPRTSASMKYAVVWMAECCAHIKTVVSN